MPDLKLYSDKVPCPGIVWESCGLGERVVIVIDDKVMHLMAGNQDVKKEIDYLAFNAIFKHVSKWEDTRAIGFFDMYQLKEDIDEVLIPSVEAWIKSIGGAGSDLYFLVDVYHDGGGKATLIGDHVLDKLQLKYVGAHFGVLSAAGAASVRGDVHAVNNREVGEFYKHTISDADKHEGKLEKQLAEWFCQYGTGKLSDYDSKQWNKLRGEAWDLCVDVMNDYKLIGHPLFAHHLDSGGESWTEEEYKTVGRAVTGKIKGQMSHDFSEINYLPDHRWYSRTSIGGVEPWERPPLRALIQFDNWGCDITSAFEVAEGALKLESVSLTIEYHEGGISGDYLWFNVSSIISGLSALAIGFTGKVREEAGKNRGKLVWSLEEKTEDKSFKISVEQQINSKAIPLPELDSASNKVAAAYNRMKSAGAELSVEKGVLLVKLTAVEREHNVNDIVHKYWIMEA